MRRSLSILLLLPMLVACDDDPTSPGSDTSHVGVYQLLTVDGAAVPVSFQEDGGTFTIVEGSITLNSNGTFSMAAEFEFTLGGETTPDTDSLSGSYTRVGNNVTFDHDGVDVGFETATVSGDLLTTVGGGDEVLVFEK